MSNWLDKLVCDEDTEPNLLLLQVKARHVFMMDDIGLHLEETYDEVLEPLESGLYRPGSIFPEDRAKLKGIKSSKDSSLYYYDFETGRQMVNPSARPPEDLENLISSKKNTFLLEKPTVPARGIRLMAAMFEYHLDQIAPYRKRTTGIDRVAALLKPDVDLPAFIENELTPTVHDELLDLNKFIADDLWFIYCTKIYGTSILIEKTVDFRVYDWHYQRYEKRQSTDE